MKLARKFLFGLVMIVLLAINGDAQQKFVYTNNNTAPSNTISAFSAAPGGQLAPVAGFPIQSGAFEPITGNTATPQTIIVGKFLYAANSNTISAYSIDPNSGALAPVAGSPFPIGAPTQKVSLSATPDGRFLFGGYSLSHSLRCFSIASDGSLLEVSHFDLPANAVPASVTVSPNGRVLAVPGWLAGPNDVGAIWMFVISQNGSLTLVPGSPFPDGTPNIGDGKPSNGKFNRPGNLLFVGEGAFGPIVIDVFNVAANGVISPIPGSPFKYGPFQGGGEGTGYVLPSLDDRFLFVGNVSTGSITVLDVAQNGSLTPIPGSPFYNGSPLEELQGGWSQIEKGLSFSSRNKGSFAMEMISSTV